MTRLVYHLKYSCYLCSGFERVYEDYPGNAAILRPQGLALLVSVSLLSFYRQGLIRGCLPLSPPPEGFISPVLPSSDLRAVTGALLDVTQDAIASGEYDGELIFNLFLLLRTLTDQILRG